MASANGRSNLFFYPMNTNVDRTPHPHLGLARRLPVHFLYTLNQAMYERWLNFVRLNSLIVHLTMSMTSVIPLHRCVVDEKSWMRVTMAQVEYPKDLMMVPSTLSYPVTPRIDLLFRLKTLISPEGVDPITITDFYIHNKTKDERKR